jgi:hypothetical protein
VPVRSSLYAVCPSVATSLAAALVIQRMREGRARAEPHRAGLILAGWPLEAILAFAALAAIPLYQARDWRWVEPARVSQRTLSAIRSDLAILPPEGFVVFHDDPDSRAFENAFGTLATVALRTAFGRSWEGVIATRGVPAPSSDGLPVIAEYRIERGRVSRVMPAKEPR